MIPLNKNITDGMTESANALNVLLFLKQINQIMPYSGSILSHGSRKYKNSHSEENRCDCSLYGAYCLFRESVPVYLSKPTMPNEPGPLCAAMTQPVCTQEICAKPFSLAMRSASRLMLSSRPSP